MVWHDEMLHHEQYTGESSAMFLPMTYFDPSDPSCIYIILSRSHKLKNFPSSYIHNDKVMTDKTAIGNAFNTYFTNTVKTSTTELNTPSNKTFKHYMNEEHTHLFCFETIDDEIISKTIVYSQKQAVDLTAFHHNY